MPSITRDEVANLARLARLDLAEDELVHLAGQLDQILGSVARVSEIAAEEIPPTSHPVALANVTRADVAEPGLTQDEALSGAPVSEDYRFGVPRILSEEA